MPLNLALVRDTSGCMAGTKVGRVKKAAAFLLRALGPAYRAAQHDKWMRQMLSST